MTFADFHFLRPEWLWALIPAAAIGWMLIRRRSAGATDGWLRHVDSHLLQHLAISGTDAKRSRLNPVIGAAMVATQKHHIVSSYCSSKVKCCDQPNVCLNKIRNNIL